MSQVALSWIGAQHRSAKGPTTNDYGTELHCLTAAEWCRHQRPASDAEAICTSSLYVTRPAVASFASRQVEPSTSLSGAKPW